MEYHAVIIPFVCPSAYIIIFIISYLNQTTLPIHIQNIIICGKETVKCQYKTYMFLWSAEALKFLLLGIAVVIISLLVSTFLTHVKSKDGGMA